MEVPILPQLGNSGIYGYQMPQNGSLKSKPPTQMQHMDTDKSRLNRAYQSSGKTHGMAKLTKTRDILLNLGGNSPISCGSGASLA